MIILSKCTLKQFWNYVTKKQQPKNLSLTSSPLLCAERQPGKPPRYLQIKPLSCCLFYSNEWLRPKNNNEVTRNVHYQYKLPYILTIVQYPNPAVSKQLENTILAYKQLGHLCSLAKALLSNFQACKNRAAQFSATLNSKVPSEF